jgi:hypothetical protein
LLEKISEKEENSRKNRGKNSGKLTFPPFLRKKAKLVSNMLNKGTILVKKNIYIDNRIFGRFSQKYCFSRMFSRIMCKTRANVPGSLKN